MSETDAVRVLGAQQRVAPVKSIIVDLEFEWVEILVRRPVDPPAVAQRPLSRRVPVPRDRKIGKKIGIISRKGRIIGFIVSRNDRRHPGSPGSNIPCGHSPRPGVLETHSTLKYPALRRTFIICIKGIDILPVIEVVAAETVLLFSPGVDVKLLEYIGGSDIRAFPADTQPSLRKVGLIISLSAVDRDVGRGQDIVVITIKQHLPRRVVVIIGLLLVAPEMIHSVVEVDVELMTVAVGEPVIE